jgi:hypothetical protein
VGVVVLLVLIVLAIMTAMKKNSPSVRF